MNKTLESVKETLRRQYLGKWGIHGVGIRRSENAVYLYLDAGDVAVPQNVRGEIEREASPFQAVLVAEDRPQLS